MNLFSKVIVGTMLFSQAMSFGMNDEERGEYLALQDEAFAAQDVTADYKQGFKDKLSSVVQYNIQNTQWGPGLINNPIEIAELAQPLSNLLWEKKSTKHVDWNNLLVEIRKLKISATVQTIPYSSGREIRFDEKQKRATLKCLKKVSDAHFTNYWKWAALGSWGVAGVGLAYFKYFKK